MNNQLKINSSFLAISAGLLASLLSLKQVHAQTVKGMAQVNGLNDPRLGQATIIHCKLWISADEYVPDASLVIREGKVVYAGPYRKSDSTVAALNAAGKVVYPAFIELISDYGMPQPPPPGGGPRFVPQYDRPNSEGKYWNEHVRSEFNAYTAFRPDPKQAADWRKLGFGYTLTHQRDGIIRGTGTLIRLMEQEGKDPILLGKAAACYSFNRSRMATQLYPTSLMGSIALIRQALYDSRAYNPSRGYNASLEAQKQNIGLPAFFEAGQRLNLLRAATLGKEFDMKFILRGSGDEYARLEEVKKTGSPLVVPINYPKAYEIQDPLESDLISLDDLMHWEMAPANLGRLNGAGIPFAITTDQLKDKAQEFWPNLRKAVKAGLPEKNAIRALTEQPAKLLNINNLIGTLKPGMAASFVIADQSLFTAEGKVMETWVEGQRFVAQDAFYTVTRGELKLRLGADSAYILTITEKDSYLQHAPDTLKIKLDITQQNGWVVMTGKLPMDTSGITRLSGWQNANGTYRGDYRGPKGASGPWWARPIGVTGALKKDSAAKAGAPSDLLTRALPRPLQAFGWTKQPVQEAILYKNATVWTNEAEGRIEGADVLVSGGKIMKVGKGLTAPTSTRTVDATGRHITPGLIDEHSHIAINGGVNECTHAVTAECRVGDVVNSEDVNVYRHLAGGVVAVQQLHGSCNPIGGQSSLIKLRWGQTPEEMKIAGADGFIKCALGENVKQSNHGDAFTVRYPQTRMGVEQMFLDAFTRARTYKAEQAKYVAKGKKEPGPAFRRDLQLEAVNEILDKKRFITCHSYVQSEIEMLMRVADSMGFRVNTFTHILEGYKIAPRMKQHGAGASTFADWWYYKLEVNDAIPYNAAVMHNAGITVAINSDDAEMGRRLNQEAGKIVRYGGVSEEDAMKMVTLNPAKLLHLDGHMGSLKPGKDADLVLWTTHPFAPGAKPMQTMVDGRIYFDLQSDSLMRQNVIREKERIVQILLKEKAKGAPTQAAPPARKRSWHCDDVESRDESFQY